MYNPFQPPPAPPGYGLGKVVPEGEASLLSRLVFQWLSPFLGVGYSRPLQKEDLWNLPQERLTNNITDKVEANFYARCPPEKRPRSLRSPHGLKSEPRPDSSSSIASGPDEKAEAGETSRKTSGTFAGQDVKGNAASEIKKDQREPKYDPSLMKALHRTFIYRWWLAGILKLVADTLNTTTPLVTKVLLTWLTEVYSYSRLSDDVKASDQVLRPHGIGYGIGVAFGLFAMQEISSLLTNHYMIMTMTTGLSMRTGIIGVIFRKSLRLSGRARLEHSVGQITTMISTDATRLDRSVQFAHNLWVAPIQIIIGIGLLLGNLGYSALVGLGVLIFGFPVQLWLVRIMFSRRKKGVKITDQRVRLVTEVLQGIRLIKFFSWESFYIRQIEVLREREVKTIRGLAMARSALIAVITWIPVLAAILSFITYSLSGHELNVAIIFTCLQFFNIIRAPLLFFPVVLAAAADATVALGRISKFLMAEELDEPPDIEFGSINAIDVDGDFTWETAGNGNKPRSKGKKGKDTNRKQASKRFSREGVVEVLPTTMAPEKQESEKEEEKPFVLKNLKLKIPKGSFVAIVGRVGSGKSSLLQALIGEMRRTRGETIFGGTVAYVPQTSWIRNATLRQNIVFGQEEDDDRFRQVIHACSLQHDLDMLPHGEETEIGEKGINLSGGQKARVSLARAAYSRSDVILLDDSLSAVDAYVGKAILDNCILSGPLAGRTRVLVTHALHVLDKTDYIYVMDSGSVIEEGTYKSLMKTSTTFSRLMDDYGSLEKEKVVGVTDIAETTKSAAKLPEKLRDKEADALMQAEERETGSVSWGTYNKYLRFAGGVFWGPVILLLLILSQGSQVGNNLFLGFWTAQSIRGFRQGQYMAIYAGLGVGQALFSFLLSFAFALITLEAGLRLFKSALGHVLRSPTSFFDTTPMGRIMSRLSKDQDTLDTELAMTSYQFLSTFSSVLGTVALVFYTFPYLGIIFAPLSVLYLFVASYYRRTSVETKRLDSLMRSALYASYSETLTGLSTIRAYGTQGDAIKSAEDGLDLENRAYYMTIAIQRWLAVRLDFFGNILVLGIALFSAGFRTTVNPSKIGVVLSYTLSITQILSEMVSQFAQNEQNMNAVERILVYTELPPEGEFTTPDDPPASWPEKGKITFNNVELAYRPGLPLVLKNAKFEIRPGEKVGIVGRTGAGKSSLLQALFRTVEIQSGTIEIDGQNTRDVGLDVLRQRLALVPQDSILFMGTLRDNLDPQNTRTDAELLSALRRAWLLPRDGTSDPAADAKFSLDSSVGDDGSNYSAGEKQLLALCRALVKNSRIIVLDEATSNVDVETDAKLQRTIQTEFVNSTLLCIAHRLNTIAYYDRVLVMDEGRVAEFDTVLNLFDREESIFRSLCNEAGLSRADILRIRKEVSERQQSGTL